MTNPMVNSYEVPERTIPEIRELARECRLRLDLDRIARMDKVLMRTLENNLILGFNIDVRFDDDKEMALSRALYDPESGNVKLRQSVYHSAVDGEPEAIFTVAHELGHCVLKHKLPSFARAVAQWKLRDSASSEWQADHFAYEFIAPVEEVLKCQSITELTIRLNLTTAHAQKRVEHLIEQGFVGLSELSDRPLPNSRTNVTQLGLFRKS